MVLEQQRVWKKIMELITQRLVLREFRQNDFDAVRDYESHPETHRFEKAIPNDETIVTRLNQMVAWSHEHPRSQYCFAITFQPENIVRGQVSLSLNISDIREWEIGWKVHYDYWGHGYATEAARGVLAFAFNDLHAHRVVAFCNVQNAASVRVMNKIGMLQDGRLRETRWWNGIWQDEFVYAILDRDWESQQK
jgi:RimJ/RimL family protein N-acetyltransferase